MIVEADTAGSAKLISELNNIESHVQALKGYKAYERGDPIYVEIDAESGDLYKWIAKKKKASNFYTMLLFEIREKVYF